MALNAFKNWLSPINNPLACVNVEAPPQFLSGDALLKTLERQLKEFTRQGMVGDKRSLLYGQGLDFADLRQYFPGDDIRKIDWNVFARTGEPHIKEYQDEKRLTLWLYIDLSPSMFFGTHKTKAQLSLEIAGLLGLLSQSGGHTLGVFIDTETQSHIIAPKAGYAQVQKILNTLFTLHQEHQWKTYNKPRKNARLQKGFQEFSQMLRGHSLVFILSDFIDVNKNWTKDWGQLARRASLYSAVIQDAHEHQFLKNTGTLTLFDPETQSIKQVDGQNKRFLKHYKEITQAYQSDLLKTLNQFSKTAIAHTHQDPITSLITLLQNKGGGVHGSQR